MHTDQFRVGSRRMMAGRVAALAVMAAGCSLLAGCLINTSSRTETSGRYIGPETMDQITPGTRQDFVLATLGEPTSRTTLDDGSELWRWSWRQSRSSDGHVFLLLSADSETTRDGSAYVQFRDGEVTRSWRD